MNTSKHTPGLPVCTCHIQTETVDTGIGAYEEYHIERCSLHTAAPAMYSILLSIKQAIDDRKIERSKLGEFQCKAIEVALTQAEGK